MDDSSIAGAGDVNDDGVPDLLVGLNLKNDFRRGAAYVVFGKSDAADVDLEALGRSGFSIAGAGSAAQFGFAVAGPGDVNGDGFDDVLIGAPFYAPPNFGYSRGAAYVIFGKRSSDPVRLSKLRGKGFLIEEPDGEKTGTNLGVHLSGAGDVNRDGLADLLINGWNAAFKGRVGSGEVYVVFGKKAAHPSMSTGWGTGGTRMEGHGEVPPATLLLAPPTSVVTAFPNT